MSEKQLVPAAEHRLAAAVEMSRRRHEEGEPFRNPHPVVTLSREFGCEATLVAEKVKGLLEAKTKTSWLLLEKTVLDELAKANDLDPAQFDRLGDRNSFFDSLVSVLSPRWRSSQDYYRTLCGQIVDLAEQGNVIFVGRGASVLLQDRVGSYHFRLVAPWDFKVQSMRRRLGLSEGEAGELIRKRQEQREAFIRDFLNRDVRDPYLYHAIFNNEKSSIDQMAATISSYVPVS